MIVHALKMLLLLLLCVALAACQSSTRPGPDDGDDDPDPPVRPETAWAEIVPFATPETTSRRFDVAVAVPDSGLGVARVEIWGRPLAGMWQPMATAVDLTPVRVTVPAEGPFGTWEFAAVAQPLSGEPVDALEAAEAAVAIPEPITITDRQGEVWEITHAVHRWGMNPAGWQFGLGRDALRPIIEPAVSCPGDADYLHPDNLTVVLGVVMGAEVRAYKLGDLPDVEVVDDVVAGVPIAVTY